MYALDPKYFSHEMSNAFARHGSTSGLPPLAPGLPVAKSTPNSTDARNWSTRARATWRARATRRVWSLASENARFMLGR
jgi:hypothetical protein